MDSRDVRMTWKDVPQVCDALCIVEPRGGGAVTVLAKAFGQTSSEKVFPNWRIPWERNPSSFPHDWLHAVFHVPELARGVNELPPITGGAQLEEAAPHALAFLLAMGAYHQGARVAIWNEGGDPELTLHIPPQGNN